MFPDDGYGGLPVAARLKSACATCRAPSVLQYSVEKYTVCLERNKLGGFERPRARPAVHNSWLR